MRHLATQHVTICNSSSLEDRYAGRDVPSSLQSSRKYQLNRDRLSAATSRMQTDFWMNAACWSERYCLLFHISCKRASGVGLQWRCSLSATSLRLVRLHPPAVLVCGWQAGSIRIKHHRGENRTSRRVMIRKGPHGVRFHRLRPLSQHHEIWRSELRWWTKPDQGSYQDPRAFSLVVPRAPLVFGPFTVHSSMLPFILISFHDRFGSAFLWVEFAPKLDSYFPLSSVRLFTPSK